MHTGSKRNQIGERGEAARRLGAFSVDYFAARQRFREAAARLGWQLEAHPIATAGPNGEELSIDVGYSSGGESENVLVVSSGLHGVEGFFGSAVQLALLQHWVSADPPPIKCVFLHALNPYGFAWLRRFDEHNVDLNRNFLLPGEKFQGAPEGYAQLDAFLNPRRPPSRWEPFSIKALWLIAKRGMPALRQAVASGQYEFPRGLFFGGDGPSELQPLLDDNLSRWLHGSRRVVHLDFHTGLGRMGECKLLIDYALSDRQRNWLADRFGADAFEACDPGGVAYDARGGFGRWCVSRHLAPEYLFACAEFGTYRPVKVLAGLRAENQAHHWGAASSAGTRQAKERLQELFCPAATRWRVQVIERSLELIAQALQGLKV